MRVLVSALAEEQGVVVQEEVSLHGLEPGQLLHSHRRPLMADPHAEASLQHHPAQLAEVTLGTHRCSNANELHRQEDMQNINHANRNFHPEALAYTDI